MTGKKLTNTQRLDNLHIEVRATKTEILAIKAALEGDKEKGIKGPFPRLFEMIEALPCNQHNERLVILETARTVNCAVKKERRRWVQNLLKVARIAIPVGAGGGILAWLGDFFG